MNERLFSTHIALYRAHSKILDLHRSGGLVDNLPPKGHYTWCLWFYVNLLFGSEHQVSFAYDKQYQPLPGFFWDLFDDVYLHDITCRGQVSPGSMSFDL